MVDILNDKHIVLRIEEVSEWVRSAKTLAWIEGFSNRPDDCSLCLLPVAHGKIAEESGSRNIRPSTCSLNKELSFCVWLWLLFIE